MPSARDTDAWIALLAERFPKTFFPFEGRRQPLKIGIREDIKAVLGDAIEGRALHRTLRAYVCNPIYLRKQVAGATRIDLDGNACGTVTEDHAKQTKDRLAGIMALRRARRAAKPRLPSAGNSTETPSSTEKPPEQPARVEPRRIGLADLKTAALKRKAQAA